MLRRAVIPALLLACGGCVMDPSRPYLGGIGDPVRGAALNAPWIFGDMSRYHGNPAGAAQAVRWAISSRRGSAAWEAKAWLKASR